jgi:mannitol 2-dehydrogenase
MSAGRGNGDGGVRLCEATLDRLPAAVRVPAYDRRRVTPGIAHIGVGAFHRAHLACYLERCLADADQHDWGLLGINLLERDAALARALQDQDGLYSVTECASDGTQHARVIGAMVEYRFSPDDPAAVLERLADPAIRIVSLTITEGGYVHSDKPAGVFGFLVGALERRRARGVAPFAVMSCDNLRHNGDQARRSCLSFARAHSPSLAQWIEEAVDFPNGMVDRITPAMSLERRQYLNNINGIEDQLPVVCEDFTQWVLEDRFRQGRPAFERHGVGLVADVRPYEEAKIRLLNGAHSMLAYPAYLAGLRQVDAALRDGAFQRYLRAFLEQDAAVGLRSLPGMELDAYKRRLLDRFANPAIADQIERLCMDGASKIPGFLKPTLEACLTSGRDARRIAFLLACFDRYVRVGRDDQRLACPLREPNGLQVLKPVIDSDSPMTLLETSALIGEAPRHDRRFVEQYLNCVSSLAERGTRATLADLGA